MTLKVVATVIAAAAVFGLLAVPADAAPKKKRVAVAAAGHTVYVSRDENGRRRTRIIIQKRSYLNPGTEVFPGENSDHRYAFPVTGAAGGMLDNTAFGTSQSSLPGPWTLRSKNSPWLQF